MLQVPGWTSGLRGEVLARDALPFFLPAWEDLCKRTVEDNVYYSPRYALALLNTVERKRNIRFAVVWDQEKLVALLPFATLRAPVTPLQAAGRAWCSKYTFSCMPLLDQYRTHEAAHALLGILASVKPAEWMIPTVNVKGEACQALISALEQQDRPWRFENRFERAVLEPNTDFDDHMNHHVSAKRRRDLARNRRRLEQLGKLEHHTFRFGAGLDSAVAAFLKIESSGWKGRKCTALACSENTRDFALRAFTGGEADSICRADLLTLNAKPIAVSLMTLAGRTGFTVKCTYDEEYRSYSPGLLLELEVIRSFLSGKWLDRLDAATAGHHVIDTLWPTRVEVADLIFSLAPSNAALRLALLQRCEHSKSALKAAIKGRHSDFKALVAAAAGFRPSRPLRALQSYRKSL
jgi:CelD/BcsL family acetyltransferase involved in cellulose biosynthesis